MREQLGETPGIFIVLSGFASSGLKYHFVILAGGRSLWKNGFPSSSCFRLLPLLEFPPYSLVSLYLWGAYGMAQCVTGTKTNR